MSFPIKKRCCVFSGFAMICLAVFFHAPLAYANGSCGKLKPKPTSINVNLFLTEPVYSLGKTKKALNQSGEKAKQNWLEKNGLNSLWSRMEMEVAGHAEGGWAASYSYNIKSRPYDRYGAYQCVFFEQINIDIMYRTIISIPSEYSRNKCAFNLVNTHELRHHEVNTEVIKTYVEKMKSDLKAMIRDMERNYIPRSTFPTHSEKLKQSVQDAVDIYFKDSMTAEMEKGNALVDTPEEYARASVGLAACGIKAILPVH